MTPKLFSKFTAGIAVGCIGAATLFTTPARSADQPQSAPAANIPDGYVLVDQNGLRKLVHDEVFRQLQDFFNHVRFEQQHGQAAARVQAASQFAISLNTQVALYRLQHRDKNPTLDQIGDGFTFLTTRTDGDGNPSISPDAFGPYLPHAAINPVTGKSKVVAPENVTTDAGWTYDAAHGIVKAVLPKELESKLKDFADPRFIQFAAAE